MRRAERLFRILQLMRKTDRSITAQEIAEALEVSIRTIYRDISHLIGSGVPIDGEAGVGYLLRDHHDLPPLTFTFEQLEALAFGAKAAAMLADDHLATAAQTALDKNRRGVAPRTCGALTVRAPLRDASGLVRQSAGTFVLHPRGHIRQAEAACHLSQPGRPDHHPHRAALGAYQFWHHLAGDFLVRVEGRFPQFPHRPDRRDASTEDEIQR